MGPCLDQAEPTDAAAPMRSGAAFFSFLHLVWTMRHIVFLHVLVLLIAAACAWAVFHDPDSGVEDPAIRINGRVFSKAELSERIAEKPYDQDRAAFLSQLISRELLIQEAKRQEIHKDAAFRKKIREFYEQTLVTHLMIRKEKESDIPPSPELIRRFRELEDKRVTFTLFQYPDYKSLQLKKPSGQVTKKDLPFETLSFAVQYRLAESFGEAGPPLSSGEGYVCFRLDGVTISGTRTERIPEEELRTLLTRAIRNARQVQWEGELWAASEIRIWDENKEE